MVEGLKESGFYGDGAGRFLKVEAAIGGPLKDFGANREVAFHGVESHDKGSPKDRSLTPSGGLIRRRSRPTDRQERKHGNARSEGPAPVGRTKTWKA